MIDSPDSKLRDLTSYQLRRATSAWMPSVNKVLADFGLRRSTYSSLGVIVQEPGLNQRQLASALAIDRPNIVQIVDELEQKNLVIRKQSESDRRAYELRPTAQGRELEQLATAALNSHDKMLTRGVTAEEKALLERILYTIEQNAEKHELKELV